MGYLIPIDLGSAKVSQAYVMSTAQRIDILKLIRHTYLMY